MLNKTAISTEQQVKANESVKLEDPQVIEEIAVEELSIDGICGVY
jgi:mycofactocin precursor